MADRVFLITGKRVAGYETYVLAKDEADARMKYANYTPTEADLIGYSDYLIVSVEEDPEGLPSGINARVV